MRRPDPSEARARELAIAAGTDPDTRVLRPFAVAMAGSGEFDPFKD